ncbi:MAG: flagellin FliC [Proteobacteria bacterium]|nr:flagellin FliC [Pseudomonadota bacterium]NDC23559.1 flagellin FliC [Pseudomonadota bacterium]NDD03694.1 flagellin FliC [Pseudomonadota bacterium]NDG26214.1 flagellin FliC [Pseudomonadota bacterium]
MGLRINTNEHAIAAQRNLEQTGRRMDSVFQRLSSGSRINKVSDDPAGLSISDALNAQVRSLGQGIRNAQDGISLVQVYEGGTNEITNILVRMRELAMQSATDTVGDKERRMIDSEVQQIKMEVDRIAKTTKYASRDLLSGDKIVLDFQVGTENRDNVDRITFDPGDTNLTASGINVDAISVLDKEGAQSALGDIDGALDKVNDIRSRIGAIQGRLNSTQIAQSIFQENLTAAKSRIRDADIAQESANMAKESILRQAGVAVLTQANESSKLALNLLR